MARKLLKTIVMLSGYIGKKQEDWRGNGRLKNLEHK